MNGPGIAVRRDGGGGNVLLSTVVSPGWLQQFCHCPVSPADDSPRPLWQLLRGATATSLLLDLIQ
jgi:hypothetical protein